MVELLISNRQLMQQAGIRVAGYAPLYQAIEVMVCRELFFQ